MTFSSAIQDFLTHCEFEKKLSDKTIKAYRTDLKQMVVFLNCRNRKVIEIDKDKIRKYLIYISKLKPKSIKRKIATFKSFFNYLEFDDKILINPFRKMKIKIKEPVIQRTVMNMHEVIRIFRKIYRKKNSINEQNGYAYFESMRNIIVLELLFNTGARVSEVANLSLSDVCFKTGTIKIVGKGNKERRIHVCNTEVIEMLSEYQDLYKNKIEASGDWLLINRFNRKLSEQSIRNLVKKVSAEAGITKHITPHVFRHTFATLLLERDVDIKYIQVFLGHSSIITTQLYTHSTEKKQRQILFSKHPRKEFSSGVVK